MARRLTCPRYARSYASGPVEGALDREPLDRLHDARAVAAVAGVERAVDIAQRAVRHRVAHERANRHAGELLLDEAELGDRLAELAPLLGVLDGVVERLLHAGHVARAELHAADVQDVERDLVTLSNRAE